jgi:hypothetical protein
LFKVPFFNVQVWNSNTRRDELRKLIAIRLDARSRTVTDPVDS